MLVRGHADSLAVAGVLDAPVADVRDEEKVKPADGKIDDGFAFAVLEAGRVGVYDERIP